MTSKSVIILTILLLVNLNVESQNNLIDLTRNNKVFLFDNNIRLANNISEISYRKYLSINERQKFKTYRDIIYSQIFVLKFDSLSKLISESWDFSGLDSNGTDHFLSGASKFKTYPFPNKREYKYNDTGQLIFIEASGEGTLTSTFFIYDDEGKLKKVHYYHSNSEAEYDILLKSDYYTYGNGQIESIVTFDSLMNITGELYYIYDENGVIIGTSSKPDGNINEYNPVDDKGWITTDQLQINKIPVDNYFLDSLNLDCPQQVLVKAATDRYWYFNIKGK